MEKIPVREANETLGSYLDKFARLIKIELGEDQFKSWLFNLGIKSRITFKHILAGRKQVSVSKLKAQLDMSLQESVSLEKLTNVPNDKPPTFYVSDEFLSSPIHTIILNLCGIRTQMQTETLHQILGSVFDTPQINSSIELLKSEKLITLNAHGSLVRIFEGVITSIPGIKSDSSKKYFETVNNLSNVAWHFPLEVREMHSYTLRIEKKDIPRLKDLIRNFRADCYKLSNPEMRDSVYQCSISAFPVFIDHEK